MCAAGRSGGEARHRLQRGICLRNSLLYFDLSEARFHKDFKARRRRVRSHLGSSGQSQGASANVHTAVYQSRHQCGALKRRWKPRKRTRRKSSNSETQAETPLMTNILAEHAGLRTKPLKSFVASMSKTKHQMAKLNIPHEE